jgi:hypothetical protein
MKSEPDRVQRTRGAPTWWLGHPAVGPAEISVLMCLLMHADRRGVCWIGQTRIGATYKRSRAWANAALRGLERAGIVAIERRRGANGRDETCLYRLMGPGGSAWTCRTAEGDDAPAEEGGSTVDGSTGEDALIKGVPGDDRTADRLSRLDGTDSPSVIASRSGSEARAPEADENARQPADRGCRSADRGRKSADTNLTQPNDSEQLSPTGRGETPGWREGENDGSGLSISIALERTAVPALDWRPGAEDVAWALGKFPDLDVDRHTERFVLSCRARGYAYRDHAAAWRRWLIEPKADLPGRGGKTCGTGMGGQKTGDQNTGDQNRVSTGTRARQEGRDGHGHDRNSRTRPHGGSDLHQRNLDRAGAVYGRILARRAGDTAAGCHA